MPVGFVILALFVCVILGAFAMVLARAAHNREEYFKSIWDKQARHPVAHGRHVESGTGIASVSAPRRSVAARTQLRSSEATDDR